MADFLWHRLLRRPYRLAVTDKGQGEPILLLHGIGAKRGKWKSLIQACNPETWRVIAPDLLGFGESPKPSWSSYSVDDHARAVRAALKRQKVKGPLVIVAHSMGCLVATHIAARHPGLVKRLVLYEPPLFADTPDYPAHSRRTQRYFAFFDYIASHPQLVATERQLLWRLARRLSGLAVRAETWTPFERSLRNTVMQQRTYDELRTLTIPTDIIYGRLDFVVIRTDVKKMFKNNTHITLHLVNQMHDITLRAAAFIMGILEAEQPRQRRKKIRLDRA